MKRGDEMSQTILMTGGGGYLGSIMTPYLLSLGYEVTALDNFLFRQNSLLRPSEISCGSGRLPG